MKEERERKIKNNGNKNEANRGKWMKKLSNRILHYRHTFGVWLKNILIPYPSKLCQGYCSNKFRKQRFFTFITESFVVASHWLQLLST